MPQTQSRIDERFLQPGGTKIGRNNNIPGNNALIIGNSNNAFSEENLILGDFNSAAGKAFILGDQNITSDSQVPIFVIGNNNTTPPNSNGIIAGHYMTFSRIFDNGYVFGADGLYQTYSISDFMIFGQPTATQSFTHSQRVYINWDVEFGPDSNVFGLAGSLIGAAGPQGFQGPFGGPQGFQGLVGNTGLQGPQGYIGNTGVQGGIGIQGPQGGTGVQGNVGPQGLLGLQGPQGLKGNTGSQGPQGLIGLTGNQGVMGPTGVGGALGSYGSYYSSLTQLNPTASMPNTIRQNELYYQNGLISDNIDTITFLNSGVYEIQLATTIFKSSTDIQEVNFWISKNGISITQSNSKVNFPHLGFTLNYSNNWIIDCNVNDYIQLYWSSDDTSIVLQSYGATGSIPFTPSSTLNISQVMYTQLGPTGSTGNQGISGSQGNTGPQGFQGPIGNTGAQGPQGFQGLMGATGAGGSLGYYGSFYSSLTQVNATPSSINSINIPNTYESNGVGTDGDNIIFYYGGTYDIQFSAQFEKTDAGTDTIDLWMRKNGIDYPYSDTKLTLVGNNAKSVPAWNFVVSVNDNDTVQLVWSSPDPNVQLTSQGTQSSPTRPAIPSMILTVTQVMNTQLGPTGSTGSQGFQGNIGVTGSTGPQGISGTIGINGNTGPQGFQGNFGPTGSTGSQGFQGPQGLTGSQGPLASDKGSFGVIFDGLGGVPSIGKTDWVVIPYNGTITGWQIFAGTTGSCVIDVRKDTYGNFPPTAADSIAGTEKPTLTAQFKNQDLSLSTWTASVVSGDIMQFYLESVTSLTKINCVIFIDKN